MAKIARLSLILNVVLLFAVSSSASVQYKIDRETLAPLSGPLARDARVKIDRIPIDGELESLELERFEVFAKDAEIRVVGENDEKVEELAPPALRLYRGGIVGDPDSVVFLSVSPMRVEGVIFKGDRRFGIDSRRRTHKQRTQEGEGIDIFIQEAEVIDDIPLDGEGFRCDVEGAPISGKPTLSSVVRDLKPKADGALSTGSARWVINIAIETDFELYTNSGSSSSNVNTFITNLIGAMSTIYNRELTAEVQIAYLGIHTVVGDPFTVVPGAAGMWNGNPVVFSTLHALLEYGDRWHNTPPSAAARSTTALVSGKSQLAGVAWVDVLCQGDFLCSGGNCGFSDGNGHYGGRYSYNGGIDPPVDLSVPNPDADAPTYTVPASNYWPLLQLSHETGHNVFSGHTHCRVLSPGDQILYGRVYVDNCFNGEAGAGCYAGGQSVPTEKGTIMSYCHLFNPGFSTNSRFIFGKTGEASHVMTDDMKAAIQTATPNLSAITAPSSMTAGTSDTASVTNVGGLTYLWTITNGVINSGQGTNSINFTANTNPTTVEIKATNTAGCSITDFKDITVNAVSYNPPTGVTATATTTTTVSISWGVPSGTTPVRYNIYRSSNGSTYSMVNFIAHPATVFVDTTAAASTAYLYKVRSAGVGGADESADSNRDLATTVLFTDDPLVAGTTMVKATHITQLRTAVNAVRTLASLGGGSYTDSSLTVGVTPAKVVHITDLRTAIDAARSNLALAAISYGETITTSTTIKDSHITEIRGGVQ